MSVQSAQNEVEFPRSLRDMFPKEAQALYVEAYKQSWALSVQGASDMSKDKLSREGAVVRDAWDAVKREFVEDPVTHRWHRIGEQAASQKAQEDGGSILGVLRRMFRRS
jgi:cation transport regulator ChaB